MGCIKISSIEIVSAKGRAIQRLVLLRQRRETRESALFDICTQYVYTFRFGHGLTAFSFSGRLTKARGTPYGRVERRLCITRRPLQNIGRLIFPVEFAFRDSIAHSDYDSARSSWPLWNPPKSRACVLFCSWIEGRRTEHAGVPPL